MAIVADDDPDVRALLAKELRRGGFDVQTAGTGTELVELTQRAGALGQLPNIVVSDVTMPQGSGLWALRRLREQFPRLPFILMTASGDEEAQSVALELGPSAVLHKPINRQDFDVVMRALLPDAPPSHRPRRRKKEPRRLAN
jgi:DNA-binding response OmpR family regulator